VDNKFYAIFMQATIITLAHALIVIATTVKAKSLNAKLSPEYHFKPRVAILDEAAQSSCSDTLCYLKLDVDKLILVGDDKQLNPTVISNDKLLKESFFCKFGVKKEEYFSMLNRQYRMHPHIAKLSNTLFYNGQIQDGVTIEERTSPIPPFTTYPVIFINCAHPERESLEETGLGNKKTYCNPH
jgi:regulator of nonsense transcripts 1